MASKRPTDIVAAESLQDLLVAVATGRGPVDEAEYQQRRTQLLAIPRLKEHLPSFLKSCRTTGQFWQLIKGQYSSYAERRTYLWNEFRPTLEFLESETRTPADQSISDLLKDFGDTTVHQIWVKALERRHDDPEGAITAARTLLETVCKHLLDYGDVTYREDSDLPGLYKMAAKTLNISPSQHSEEVFRQILGGCTSVVEGLGALRNRLSDAHGKGLRPVKPAPRHAELAVNLAGTMATFLVQTWSATRESKKKAD